MLVLVSDLHLTDGSTAANVHPEAFTSVLLGEITGAMDAKHAAELHIVLLGDIFDLVRTDYWVRYYLEAPEGEQAARAAELPWNDSLDPDTAMNKNTAGAEAGYHGVLKGIFQQPVFAALCDVLRGVKAKAAEKKIPLKLSYVIGNHDRPLNNFLSLRDAIKEALLKNAGVEVQFARELTLPDYEAFARHGHIWDNECHGYELFTKVLHPGEVLDRFSEAAHKVQAFGEVVTAELMSGLVYRVRARLQKDGQLEQRKTFLEAIKDINNVRPYTQILGWLTWKLAGTYDDYEKEVLTAAAKDTALALTNTELFKLWKHTLSPVTQILLGVAEIILKQNWKLDTVIALLNRFSPRSDKEYPFARHAAEEAAAHKVQYVIYGHTHEAKAVYFAGEPDNRVQMYLNTGTYLPLIQKTKTGGFAQDYRMTLMFFYLPQEDNRNGNKLSGVSVEFWNGMKRKVYAGG